MNEIGLAKINVQKINKDRLFKGEKGIYLDIVIIPTPKSEHQDFMITESITKEEREAGKQGKIIGGGKYRNTQLSEEEKDDLPF